MRVAPQLRGFTDDELARLVRRGLVYLDGDVLYPVVAGAATCTANFETGTNGNTVATGDTGNATAFDLVPIAAGGTAKYDTTHIAHGGLACKMTQGATNGVTCLQWSTAFGTQTDHYGRIYLYRTGNPVGNFQLIRVVGGGVLVAAVQLTTTGKLSAVDSGATVRATSTNSISLNQYVRIEWHIVHSTTVGSIEIKLFNSADSSTATETVTVGSLNTAASAAQIRLGYAAANAAVVSESMWLDAMVAAAAGYPGAFSGFTLAVGGSTTPAGTVENAAAKATAGASTPAGTVANNASKNTAGAITPAGSILNTARKLLAGATTPAGTLAAAAARLVTLAGSISPAGTLANVVRKALAGAATPVGTVGNKTAKAAAGATSPTGNLASAAYKALAGATSPTGSETYAVGKSTAGAITPTGALLNAARKFVAGALSPIGDLATSVSSAGTAFTLAVGGAISPSGVLAKLMGKSTAGSTSPTSAVIAAAAKSLAGTMTPAGILESSARKTLAGSVSPTGSLISAIGKALSGTIVPGGSLANAVSKFLAGSVDPVGDATLLPARFIAGATTGTLAMSFTGRTDSDTTGVINTPTRTDTALGETGRSALPITGTIA